MVYGGTRGRGEAEYWRSLKLALHFYMLTSGARLILVYKVYNDDVIRPFR